MYTNIDLSSQTENPISLLLTGAPGAGKTFKAAQFPRPAIISFDRNWRGLTKLPAVQRDTIKIVDPRKDIKTGKDIPAQTVFDNFCSQLEAVCCDPDVRTVVIDSLSTMAEALFDKIVGTGSPSKKLEIQHYGDFSRYMKWLGETLMLAPDRDKHIVLIAHEQIMKNELTQEIIYTLNIPTNFKDKLDLYFTDHWRVFTKATSAAPEYWVRVLPGVNFRAKCSVELPPQFNWDKDCQLVFNQVK